jgi:predicted nucleotidyltransferase component of viral defense system
LIALEEIEERAADLEINTSDLQRDYVFGWLISGVYQASAFSDVLVLKGGNALRKGYFPATRFSDDLDFTTAEGLDSELVLGEFNKVCAFAEECTGIRFDLDRNRIVGERLIDKTKRIYKLHLYFGDFTGRASHITLKVRVDVTEYDRLYLPPQTRRLIHQYSDAQACSTDIRCVALEEALADKLKCLIQRRYSYDLFDLVYGIFLNQEFAVDRSELVRVFLRKTIFERSPAAAKNLLLGVPLDLFRGFWGKVVCPAISRISFDNATNMLREGIEALFAPFGYGVRFIPTFFPPELRTPIIEAGSDRKLLHLTYHGVMREIEPYSLTFKRRQDGIAQEYFYAYDRTGGRKRGPGIKAFLQGDIRGLEITDETFEPRYEIELSKAGDRSTAGYFRGTSGTRTRSATRRSRSIGSSQYVVQCNYCGRRFQHKRPSTRLNPHKDSYGNPCYGRVGFRVF